MRYYLTTRAGKAIRRNASDRDASPWARRYSSTSVICDGSRLTEIVTRRSIPSRGRPAPRRVPPHVSLRRPLLPPFSSGLCQWVAVPPPRIDAVEVIDRSAKSAIDISIMLGVTLDLNQLGRQAGDAPQDRLGAAGIGAHGVTGCTMRTPYPSASRNRASRPSLPRRRSRPPL